MIWQRRTARNVQAHGAIEYNPVQVQRYNGCMIREPDRPRPAPRRMTQATHDQSLTSRATDRVTHDSARFLKLLLVRYAVAIHSLVLCHGFMSLHVACHAPLQRAHCPPLSVPGRCGANRPALCRHPMGSSHGQRMDRQWALSSGV